MIRTPTYLLLAAVVLVSLGGAPTMAATSSPNLLHNPSFETGATTPTRWEQATWEPDGQTFGWDSSVRWSGQRSVRLHAATPNDASWLQTVSVEPHTEYRLSGYIRTRGVAHSAEPIDAGANLSLYNTWQRSAGIFGDQDWSVASLFFVTGEEREVTIAARLGYWSGATTGTAWFDDLRLERWHTPTAQVTNSGFETGDGNPAAWRAESIEGDAAFAWDTAKPRTGGRSARVSVRGQGIARWQQTVLVAPDSEYELSGWLRTAHIVDPPGQWWTNGARIGIYGQDSYLAAATPGSRDAEWTFVNVRFATGSTTRATVACGIGDADNLYARATSSGTVWCDDLRLTRLRGLTRRSYQGDHVGLDVYAEDDVFERPQRYVALLDEVYLAMAELVGGRPYSDDRITVRSDASMYYGLLSGNPILIGPGRQWAEIVNIHGMDFGVPHELGHNFDIEPAASHYMGNLTFHNAEHWANFKLLYAYDVLAARYPELTQECDGVTVALGDVGACFATRARATWLPAAGRDYTEAGNDIYTGMLYGLRQQIGWAPFKCAFRSYARLEGNPPPSDQAKLQAWVDTLSRCAGRDLAPYYRSWGVPVASGTYVYLPLLRER